MNQKTQDPNTYSMLEIILAFITLLLGYMFIKLCLSSTLSAGAFLFFTFFIILSAVIFKYCNMIQSKKSKVLMSLSLLFSCQFILSSNFLFKIITFLLILVLIALWVYSVNNHTYEGIQHNFIFVLAYATFVVPFRYFSQCYQTLLSFLKQGKYGKILVHIFYGLLFAIPVTIVCACLLLSSDPYFNHIMIQTFGNFIESFFINAFQFFLGVPFAFSLFGILLACLRKWNNNNPDSKKCQAFRTSIQIFNPTISITSVVPICIVYFLFFITQINYFISAFQGILPKKYSISQYARRGFFELCTIVLINLSMILIIYLFTKRNKSEISQVSKPIRAIIFILSIFTIVLITTALSKMVLYINRFGLTPLRLYTSWFMILLLLLFMLILIRQIRIINIRKITAQCCIIMYIILSFSNVDSMILTYNFSAFESGKLKEFDTSLISSLSNDCIYQASTMFETSDVQKRVYENVKDSGFSKGDLRTYNLPDYLAYRFTKNFNN